MHTPSTPTAEPDYRAWIGRSERLDDLVTAAPLRALSATLDRDDPEPQPGSEVPPLGHWLYFLPTAPAHALGPDGHPQRGGFLPPVALPRRMWAGGRLHFLQPLRVGDEVQRRSHIADVRSRQGRSGPLVFVTVRHEIECARGLALTEEHDIVYRGLAGSEGGAAQPAEVGAASEAGAAGAEPALFSRSLSADAVLLFRYSALTFNGHRIHYDRQHATEVEGYPGLIVHGPLIATLLVDLLRRQQPQAMLRRFAFQARRPVFDGQPFSLNGRLADGGRSARLWAADASGALAMEAQAELG